MKGIALSAALALAVLLVGIAEAKSRTPMQRSPQRKTAVEGSREVPSGCCIKDVDTDGDGVADRLDRCPNTPPGCHVDDYGCPWDSDQDGVCDGLDQCPDTPLGSKVDRRGCDAAQLAARGLPRAEAPESRSTPPAAAPAPKTTAPQSEVERKLIATGEIRLENVYFDTDKATLLPESESSLDEAGQVLEKFSGLRIEVQGHTDTRGTAKHNQRLSQARAETVRDYLSSHFHLDPSNLIARGYGESRPEVKEKNDEDRHRNRRVVLKVLNPDALPRGIEVKN
ncbi:MAG TPA: OmpA family protein [Candidatus Udaeobacter sp.]|nr:OmpA family protein [Candidatus Udaeobacter sp.]